MRGKTDGNEIDLQTTNTHQAGDFDQLLNDEAALLDFMVRNLYTRIHVPA